MNISRIRVAALAALLAVVPTLAAGDGETCDAGGEAAADRGRDTVSPTRPGPWRQDEKLHAPRPRTPGTKSLAPVDRRATDAVTDGRWVHGYRPETAEAQAALEAWKAAQAAALGSADGMAAPNRPGANYAANLLSGVRAESVPDEPITHIVRDEKSDVFAVDVLRLSPDTFVEAEERGEREVESEYDEHSGMTWAEYNWAKKQAEYAPPTLDAQAAGAWSSLAPTAGGVSFDAIGPNGSVPPDPILAVGPGHLVAIVNTRYRVWDKNGTPLIAAIPIDQFFNGVPHCSGVFDPFVDYDEASNRFVMGGIAVESTSGQDSYLCIAATATNDPTGIWNRTSFRADLYVPDTWIDYPHMGIGLDAVYITGNMFRDTGGFDHVRAFAVDKDALYQGMPVTAAEAIFSSLFFTAQPVKLHGYTSGGWPAPGTPHHFIAHDGGGNSRIWRWSDPFQSGPVVYGTVAEAAFNGVPPSAPELGTLPGNYNDTGSGRWLDAEYRGGKLWATRNTGCNVGGGAAESCVDWVQIDVSGPTPVLEQQQVGGAYGSADDFRYYPDLAVDRNGGIAIGYTKSSLATHTQIWVTGREFGDPPGTLQNETLLRAGLGNYTDGVGCGGNCDRWGDYTGMTVDPDGCTFWYLGEYSDGGAFNWGTHIGSFRFDSCSSDSLVQLNKGTFTCDDTLTLTVTDSTPIDVATVAARTTVSTTGGDTETIPEGLWTGSDCAGGSCGIWTTTLPVQSATASVDDGTIDVADGDTITVHYDDPHPAHAARSLDAAVACKTRLEDGGYLTSGGCEGGESAETYRNYMDGGEYISYTFGIYNPPGASALTDIDVELVVDGPAADKITIFNPTAHIGSLGPGELTAPVFDLYIDPTIDAPGLRMSEHDFNLRVTSAADGLTVPQTLTQRHFLQADDTIVTESECWNFESGSQGFIESAIQYQYTCNAALCGTQANINTVAAPWSVGAGCGSETRTDDPSMTCDTGGTGAFKSNPDPAACNVFTQTKSGNLGTLVDTVLYSPVFGPAHTGLAPNGQPWFYDWQHASWYYRSDMVSFIDPALGVGFLWDRNYPGTDVPGVNEIYDYYPYFYGYLVYPNSEWDSATPWDPQVAPTNLDGVTFNDASGLATTGLKWRWAVEVYDTDFGGNPLKTPATQGIALDNLDLTYVQYHADGQVGICQSSSAVVSLDRYSYLECPSDTLSVRVLDATGGSSVQVTVTSAATGDSETFSILGPGPSYTSSLPFSTAGGPRANDGTLLVAPSDKITATYHGGSGSTSTTAAYVDCQGGDIVTDGVAGLQDNGDGDGYADTNELVNISIRLRNDTGRDLHNVRAIIDSDDPTIDCIGKPTASFGTITAGGVGANDLGTDPFTFKVSGSVACTDPMVAPTARFRVLILADDFAGPAKPQQVTLDLDLDDQPGTVTFVEPFTTEPAGFVHELGPGDDDGAAVNPNGYPCTPYEDRFFWRGTGGSAGGGYFCWKNPADDFPSGDYGDLSDSVLYSPTFKLGASNTTLSFDHEYLFAYSGSYRVDGARVDYRVNGGAWRKLTTLPYDGSLIWNTYCNPLCNGGGELGEPCFAEAAGAGEQIFNQLGQGPVSWRSVSGAVSGLSPGDVVQFRWRVGSMRSSSYGISTAGGYGLDNVSVTNVVPRTCDTKVHPDVGCGLVFDHVSNLLEVCGDGDSLVEPTERWSVDVTLRNSSSTQATGTTADLVVSAGSLDAAAVSGNPGEFGALASGGGTGTATYEFVVAPGAACVEDLLFDLRNVTAASQAPSDQASVFTVPVGGVGAQQAATQAADPLVVSNGSVLSELSPALVVATPTYDVTLDYDASYVNSSPSQVEHQTLDPLVIENGSVTTLLGAPFTISPDNATAAVVDWTTLSHQKVTECTRVFLQTPHGATWTLKAIGEAPANPYDVLTVYRNAAGGAGQYLIGIEEVVSGPCKLQASLSGATMTVTDQMTSGTWTADARVSLWDGTIWHVIKNYGAADTSPYDVQAIYDAAGPGTYAVRLEENGAGGQARITGVTLGVAGIECDAGCDIVSTPAPPVADGAVGSPLVLGKGAGANEVTVAIDTATCSSSHAVMLYGSIGSWGAYQGAVGGCDIGSGPTATVTAPGGSIWFNVIWVNDAGAGGHPGFASSGPRTWSAAGLCSVVADDPSDGVCD